MNNNPPFLLETSIFCSSAPWNEFSDENTWIITNMWVVTATRNTEAKTLISLATIDNFTQLTKFIDLSKYDFKWSKYVW